MVEKEVIISETKRLRLEEASLTDESFFFSLLTSPNWLEFIGDRNIHSLADAKNYIQKSLIDSYKYNGFGLYKLILKESNTPIGICGLLQRDYLSKPDLGFAILPEYERNGHTLEAAKAVLIYAKNELQIEEVLAITTDANPASQQLLKKLGFHQSGRVKPDSNNNDYLLYCIDLS